MNINRIECNEVYTTNGVYTEEQLINRINRNIKVNSQDRSLSANFKLNEVKSNKKMFFFENPNFNQVFKETIGSSLRFILTSLLILIALIVILRIINTGFAAKIGGVFILVFLWRIYVLASLILKVPKNLILRNGLIYEKNYLGFKINRFYFDKIVQNSSENFEYLYFKRKKYLIDNSLIFFGTNELENQKLINFFNNFTKITHDITFMKK